MNWFNRLLTPPTFEDADLTARARLLHPLLLAIIALLIPDIVLIFILAPGDTWHLGPVIVALVLSCVSLLWVERRGQVRLASYLLITILWLVVTTLAASGGVRAPGFLSGYLALIVITGLLVGGRGSVLVTLSSLAVGLALVFAQDSGLWKPSIELPLMAIWSAAAMLFCTVAIAQYIATQTLKAVLKQAQNELAERRQAEDNLQRTLQQEQRLNEVILTISSSLDLKKTLPNVVRLATEMVGARMGSLALLTPNGEELVETYNYNMPPELSSSRPLLRGEGVSWMALETGQPVYVDDYPGHPRALDFTIQAGIRAFLCVPVVIGEAPIGVLKLFSRHAGKHFTQRDVTLATLLGQQAGIAIHNARLFEQTQQRARQLSILNQVGQTVSSLRDLPGVLETIYQQAQQSLAVDVFFVGLYEAETNLLSFPILYDSGRVWEEPPFKLIGDSLAKQVIMTGQPCLLNRSAETLSQGQPPNTLIGDTQKASASLMLAPLRSGEQIIGVISVQSYTLNAYDSDDLALFIGIANQVAVAIQNARLFEATRRQLEELRVLHTFAVVAVQATDQAQLLNEAAHSLGSKFFSDMLAIWLYDEKTQELHCAARYDPHPSSGIKPETIPLHKGVVGNVAASRQTRRVDDVSQEPAYLPGDPLFRSELCVPMRNGEQIIGVINAESRQIRAFSDADERLLATIAGLLTTAIERLRSEAALERRVQQRTAQLEATNRELESFSYSVSHDLRAPLRGIDGYSHLLLEDYAAQLPVEAQTYVANVRQGARRMNQLIDDLLIFSRLSRQPLHKEHIQPALLVQQVLDELKPEIAGRQVEVVTGELPTCLADPALLRQVFANLLGNAFKYSSKRPVAHIEVGYQMQTDKIVYFVRDNGIGFDMRFAEKIFGVFQRLHLADDYEGTGVGLATVQRIVQRHGGQVWAEAETDRGATFYFTLAPE